MKFYDEPAASCDPALVDLLEAAVAGAEIKPHRLPSGAGHDALALATLCPIAMLFVRCKGGISHHPANRSPPGTPTWRCACCSVSCTTSQAHAMPTDRPLWLRNPLAILADGDAGGGIVVAGGRIVELVPAGRQPLAADPRVFDASAHVVLPGPDQHASPLLPDPDPRLPPCPR